MKPNELKEWSIFFKENPIFTIFLAIVIVVAIFLKAYLNKKAEVLASAPQKPISQSAYDEHSGILLKGNKFIKNKVGISAPKDADIKMHDNTFESNEKSIDIRDK